MNTHRMLAVIAMIIIATASTLVPHPPNFTPLAAIALFAGAQLNDRRVAFALTLGTLLLRDAVIGFHLLMPVVYVCYAINVGLGFWLRSNQRPWRVAGVTLLGSVIFFVVTNFAVWAAFDTYAHTAEGLLKCYVAAIPYFRNTVCSDLLYSIVMFGGFGLAQARVPALRPIADVK
jgi:hypothetical protein